MTLRAMVVENEPFARDDLLELIVKYPEVEVLWQADSLRAARALLARHTPDVLYLDVQLGDGDAFELMGVVPVRTQVVFVSGFDAYAVRAFEVNALDYLLKPVSRPRFELSLARLVGPTRQAEPESGVQLRSSDRILIKSGTKREMVRISDLVQITSLGGNYTDLWMVSIHNLETRRTMRDWQNLLPSGEFLRVNRSSIVNLTYVVRLRATSHRTVELEVNHLDEPIIVSRRCAKRVKSALDLLSRLPSHLNLFQQSELR